MLFFFLIQMYEGVLVECFGTSIYSALAGVETSFLLAIEVLIFAHVVLILHNWGGS